jgi:rfaE bifunctional protein kinase chain/domain
VISADQLLGIIERFSAVRAGVLGDLMADRFIYGNASRISPEAPVPVVQIRQRTIQPGGAANVGNNILSLGGQLRLFGVLGDDEPGREISRSLRERGAQLSGVLMLAGRPSTVKTRVVAQSQQIVRFDEEETSELPPAETERLTALVLEQLPSLDVLIVSDYAKGVLSAALIEPVLGRCRELGVRTFIDPKPVNIGLFAGADVIKPNYREALRLTGREREAAGGEMAGVCREVRERSGARDVVITAGSQGMFLLYGEQFAHLPGLPREVYDMAGAGDTSLATLALALASGAEVLAAGQLANLAGSIAVGKLGIASVTAEELREEVMEVYGGTHS